MFGKIGLFLIHIDRDQLEIHGRVVLQAQQDIEHGIRVFAARQAHHDPVTGINHVVVRYGPAGIATQALLQLIEISFLLII